MNKALDGKGREVEGKAYVMFGGRMSAKPLMLKGNRMF